jgi:hypothetical protein
MIRAEIEQLVEMGPLPDSATAAKNSARLEDYQRLIEAIEKPVSGQEAQALAKLFGPDDCFGLAWSLVHLIESAPDWPQLDRLPDSGNEWIELLRSRAQRGRDADSPSK